MTVLNNTIILWDQQLKYWKIVKKKTGDFLLKSFKFGLANTHVLNLLISKACSIKISSLPLMSVQLGKLN